MCCTRFWGELPQIMSISNSTNKGKVTVSNWSYRLRTAWLGYVSKLAAWFGCERPTVPGSREKLRPIGLRISRMELIRKQERVTASMCVVRNAIAVARSAIAVRLVHPHFRTWGFRPACLASPRSPRLGCCVQCWILFGAGCVCWRVRPLLGEKSDGS